MLKDLIIHLRSCHNKSVEISEKTFDNFQAFSTWKEGEEKRTNSSYVLQCAPQTNVTSNVKRYYYYCHRSGIFNRKGSGIRDIKAQGTCKLGFSCTAYIKAVENLTTKLVNVEYCFFHYGHKEELAHLRISEDLRKNIASKLQEGVSEKKILDGIRNNVHGDISREHLVTLQDIQNICRQYNIDGIQRHSSDHQSVKIWVEEMSSQIYNPVLLHKVQGEEPCIEMENLKKEDMLLVIQTEFQKDMMVKFGNNIVCLDATHGTTMYDFLLITVVVVDEYGEGVPIAWALSNREDKSVLVQFLKSVKTRVGSLSPNIIMSDCAGQYYGAWVAVFEGTPKKLLCTWHVDKAWRRKLNECITEKEDRITIYHHLRVLLEEKDIARLRILLQQFLSFLHKDHSTFLAYFQNEYVPHIEEWAYAYRHGAEINTSMYVETFHRVLKVVYLESKQNRRVDHLLTVLLRFARDKAFERIQKLEKGKSSHRIKEINKRHGSAEEMMSSGILPIKCSENSWKVASQKTKEKSYIVTKVKDECACLLRCSSCHVCVHMFSCSCADAHLHSTVCKHSHIVQVTSINQLSELLPNDDSGLTEFEDLTNNREDQNLYEDLVFLARNNDILSEDAPDHSSHDETCTSESPDTTEYFARVLQSTDRFTELHDKKSLLKDKIHELLLLVDEADNPDGITTATRHVITGIHSLKAMMNPQRGDTDFPVNKRPAPNANHQKQPRFFSTKRRGLCQKDGQNHQKMKRILVTVLQKM